MENDDLSVSHHAQHAALQALVGAQVSIYGVCSMMASTFHLVGKVVGAKLSRTYVGGPVIGVLEVVPNRKRSPRRVELKPSTIVVPGVTEVLTDSEFTHAREHGGFSFSGNACLNLVGEVPAIRSLVESNVNPFFAAKDAVLALAFRDDLLSPAVQCAFPEVSTTHAVVARIRAQTAIAA